jgi:ankyrin repeat protein
MAKLLLRYGATPSAPVLDEQERFIAACFRLDRDEVLAHLEKHPEYLHSPDAIFAAAQRDRADVVEFLLDLGVPIEVQNSHKQRTLHMAAGDNALNVARLLIERGAEVDPRETQWDTTPIGWAAYGNKIQMVDFLSRFSRNVWTLAFRGYVDRLREVLRAEPERAKVVGKDGTTPLWWLPDDEAKAIELVDLFMAHGADPSIADSEGKTAADWALKRGMREVARKLMVDRTTAPPAPPPPDLEKYESLARDLLFAYETGHAEAMQRVQEYAGRSSLTWEELRAGVRRRLETIPDAEKPAGYFGIPHARWFIARQAGFDNWAALVKALEPVDPASIARPGNIPPSSPASPVVVDRDVPLEMRTMFPVELQDGVYSTTTDVWTMLTATRDGDLERVRALVSRCPSLIQCDYNYMRPLHLAVREGHVEIVRYLLEHGAADPKYVTYPYRETLPTMAQDRGYREIEQLLAEYLSRPDLPANIGDSGQIKYDRDDTQRRFQKLVNADALAAVEALLKKRPDLALDEFAFWSEGILSMPAHDRCREMLELLMRYGARVPDVSKWGREYYFKHYDIAVFLMENGMNPNHMNCHHTTLLHAMAQEGHLQKARLLLDHGADLNAVDREFRSTPLGLAARWGQGEMVTFLLERGADPNTSDAPWATPLAWARKKGHPDIEADLRRAGARDIG